MRICIIGSGIAGLTTAFALCGHPEAELTVYEQDVHFGGRADVGDGGEHCPRFFMDDYRHLLRILGMIKGPDGRTVHESLRRVRRFAHTETTGWVEISHLYRMMAKEIPLREKLRVLWAWRPSPLLAERHFSGRGDNRYGSARNYSAIPLARMAANLFRSKTAFVLPGATDEYLVDPWVTHLRERGVTLTADRRVSRIEPSGGIVQVHTRAGAEEFDAVVVTAFVPDMVALLDASRIDHTVDEDSHTHCVAFTVDLDAREAVLREPGPVLYSRDGINVLVQPEAGRCVVLCTLSPRTDEEYVMEKVRLHLDLRHPVRRVRTRPNQRPGEAILVGDYLRPGRILRRPAPGVYFAGSAIHNSYPIDSAEGAARSALTTAALIRHDLGLRTGHRRSIDET
ncbi:FAD-dependent oxidoreductase [Streptomyces sp. NY05-11A]|uniref:FAD-dependent oxidoreductase n=1 Tax=Streptomyces soliscabiei TaxID=588897 RepID=UPI0029BAA198|nr:FAD-dependent oxidoreductase [Streptomyces sp. NY05-11A]MDX2680349.1 FAD-dependent oxidoreductase [Streptomyces sp. NY05-11A]